MGGKVLRGRGQCQRAASEAVPTRSSESRQRQEKGVLSVQRANGQGGIDAQDGVEDICSSAASRSLRPAIDLHRDMITPVHRSVVPPLAAVLDRSISRLTGRFSKNTLTSSSPFFTNSGAVVEDMTVRWRWTIAASLRSFPRRYIEPVVVPTCEASSTNSRQSFLKHQADEIAG